MVHWWERKRAKACPLWYHDRLSGCDVLSWYRHDRDIHILNVFEHVYGDECFLCAPELLRFAHLETEIQVLPLDLCHIWMYSVHCYCSLVKLCRICYHRRR